MLFSLKGWAADVEVAAGRPLGRGSRVVEDWLVAAIAEVAREMEKFCAYGGEALRFAARSRQRRQSILADF